MSLTDLPDELLLEVATFLCPQKVFSVWNVLARTCKRLAECLRVNRAAHVAKFDRDHIRFGVHFWRRGNLPHREGGEPAILFYSTGYREYYVEGLPHRENGLPAIDSAGYKEYRENGLLHRENGPAKEWSNGRGEFWIQGVKIK